ncbi:LysE family translocator [Agrobacterium rubi]|uniref:RhtB family transporter n=1 Tax=Agrobacterium rubi TR3 = NBRC 13261 TaxID=1368415 RepID=A0A081CRB9_9HYPH|nr:lysine transporter LysE [Agrobacterium rubi]MBP1876978.1 threonine/homoserine/homoserine lactone efflux protein [Agrobacterium rubi]MCL6651164.1 lysine transporter LysE [Agrobacterium rubi]NTF07917.1 LysE family translocator [Agrobacterium rubi]NTF20161.1 LysE family translocator [Agrobacterium rubi]NTF27132.1 LysE family translocator [Agrobacterium rubi]
MSAQVWLVFCFACAILFALPSPVSFKVASYTAIRGKRAMIAAVTGATLGIVTTVTAASIIVVGAELLPSTFVDIARWAGTGWLMLFSLWTIATPAAREANADNDNLRGKSFGTIFSDCFVMAALRLRYFGFFVAFLMQFLNGTRDVVEMVTQMQAVLLLIALVCLGLQAAFARFTITSVRRMSANKKVKNSKRKSFIAGRAVSAGYRRIAA